MKVCYLTNIPSPYRVDYFNELGKYCDLTVIFEKKRSVERNSEWKAEAFKTFKGVFLDGVSVTTDSAFSLEGFSVIKKNNYDIIVSTNYSTLMGMMQIAKMKMLKIPYFLEADGGVAGTGRGLKEKIKKKIIKGAQLYFSTSPVCDEYFLTYGANKNQLRRYPFTSIQRNEIADRIPSQSEKNELKKELEIVEKNVIISVGRFSYQNGYGKGFDTLVKVCEQLPQEYGVYIIGDEPTDEFLSIKKNKDLKNLHFVSFKVKKQLTKYYRAADLSVLLSRAEAWGLVINESMAAGTPVIATKACIAGLELIRHGKNGYLVEVNDVEKTKQFIMKFFSDFEKRNLMQLSCIETAKKYTIQSMAEEHIIAFKEYCKGR